MSRKPKPEELDTPEKIDLIVKYLDKMNKRDRLRTVGAFFRSIIMMIPIALMLGFGWYLHNNFDDFLDRVTAKATSAAMGMTTGNVGRPGTEQSSGMMNLPPELLEQLQNILPQ